MRQHQYRSTALLNARYQNWPISWETGEVYPSLQGVGAGILTQSPMGSLDGALGAAAGNYPWRAPSGDTRAVQIEMNKALRANGYCEVLTEDGEMGPATCGAIWTMLGETGNQTEDAMPASCNAHRSEWKMPKKCANGGAPRVSGAGMSDTTWLLLGGGVAAAAVGLALYMRKKKGS